VRSLDENGSSKTFYYCLRKQNLVFENKLRKVFTFGDVTKLHENQELQSQNKLIQLVSSSCNHEMLAPIRCIIQMASSLLDRCQDSSLSFDLTVIFNTSSFLLNQVQSNLDYSLLDQNKLQAKLSEHSLKSDVVQPVLDIFAA
jgi:light-regulated signal transduction histidine kinase (bacteriophytochrome)